MTTRLVMLFLIFAPSGRAQTSTPSPFDASTYFNEQKVIDQEKAAQAAKDEAARDRLESIKEAQATIDGVKYRTFSSAAGTVYLPDTGPFSQADLERASCGRPDAHNDRACAHGDEACLKRAAERRDTVPFARAEKKLSGDVTAYADLLLLTIKNKCGQGVTTTGPAKVDLKPEVGIKFKDEKKRNPKEYKIYKDSLDNKVGVGLSF